MRVYGFADKADGPVRGNPFPGGMSQNGRELDLTGGLIDRGRLEGSDLVLAEALPDDIKATGQ